MKYFIFLLFASCYLLMTNGCVTFESEKKQDEVAQMRSTVGQELSKVKDEVNTLKGRIDELQYKIDKITQIQSQQSNELNTSLKESHKQTLSDIDKKLAGITAQIQSLEKNQSQDKKELEDKINIIAEEVSKENKELRKEIDSLKKARISVSTASVESGYYVVTEGDTLSKIAQASGVSLKELMEINGILDPNSIKIGQKLRLK